MLIILAVIIGFFIGYVFGNGKTRIQIGGSNNTQDME